MSMKLTGGRPVEPVDAAPVVILCRTQIGENVGAAARAMLNFGLIDLRLVRPECGWPNAKAVAMASGAVTVLNGVTVHGRLEDAIADLHHVFATSARPREMTKPVLDDEAAARSARAQIGEGRKVGFVFGAERTGLENAELLLADAIVTFRTHPGFSSLNLAQAVLLMAAAWGRSHACGEAGAPPEPGEAAATKGEVDGLLRHLIEALDEVEFFKSESGRQSLEGAIKLMIERRGWTRPEVNLMRGIVKELLTGRRRRS